MSEAVTARLRAWIAEYRAGLQDRVCAGRCASIEEYRNATGQLRALADVEYAISEITKELSE